VQCDHLPAVVDQLFGDIETNKPGGTGYEGGFFSAAQDMDSERISMQSTLADYPVCLLEQCSDQDMHPTISRRRNCRQPGCKTSRSRMDPPISGRNACNRRL